MANQLKELLNRPLPRGNSSRASLLVLIGAYLIYMAYQMVRDTLSGVSSMDMTTTVILAGIMALGGLGVVGYAVCIWRAARKAAQTSDTEGQEVTK